MNSPQAALDLGTNSTRYICVDAREAILPQNVLARGMDVTRLGEGVDDTGEIAPEARKRVLGSLRNFNDEVRNEDGEWIGAVATSACRRASDESVDVLFEEVEALTGVWPEVIDGTREAELTYEGIAASLPDVNRGQIVDIGGGSTEWITFDESGLQSTESLSIGVVTLLERCVDGSRCSSQHAECMNEVLDNTLTPRNINSGPLVCVGGTGTTLSSVQLGLEQYEPSRVHGYELNRNQINALYDRYLGKPFNVIAREPMIQSGRAEVILPGILILKKALRLASCTTARVSDMGILAGLLSEANQA